MRVLQAETPASWVKKSTAPGEAVASLALVGTDLVDDQKLFTFVGKLRNVLLSEDTALSFLAKDDDTLIRGLNYVAKHMKGTSLLRTFDRTGISVWAGTWNRGGPLRYPNKFTAGVTTVGANILEFSKRKLAEMILLIENLDRKDMKKLDSELYYAMRNRSKNELKDSLGIDSNYTSFKDAMAMFGRDERLAREGAFVYVCRSVDMPRYVNRGKVQNQIPCTLTMSEVAVKTRQLFH
jgi:hypothetical protein